MKGPGAFHFMFSPVPTAVPPLRGFNVPDTNIPGC